MTRAATVIGVGMWSAAYASWDAWRRGAPTEQPTRPRCEGVRPSVLRGASVATCAAVEAMQHLARDGAADLSRAAMIFGSTLGEIQTAVALNAMIRDEGLPSPLRFKNSVHNVAAGLASIAHGNTGFSTSISAGGDLVGACLLEALAWLDEAGGDALVVLAEEEIPAPLPGHGAYPPLAVALHLRAGGAGPALCNLRLDPTAPRAPLPPVFERCPAAAALHLLDALAEDRAATVGLSVGEGARWCVDVLPAGVGR